MMVKLTTLDGLRVRGSEFELVRIHHPSWWRIDRHVSWLLTPKDKRASVTISFLGPGGHMVVRHLRAIAES